MLERFVSVEVILPFERDYATRLKVVDQQTDRRIIWRGLWQAAALRSAVAPVIGTLLTIKTDAAAASAVAIPISIPISTITVSILISILISIAPAAGTSTTTRTSLVSISVSNRPTTASD
jgi:hypothetical protein